MNAVDNSLPPWTCEYCTWVNDDSELACTMCYITHPSAKNLPVQWEWQPNPDQWIPFDKLSSAEIEAAYQRGASGINPTAGYYSRVGDRYTLRLDYVTRKFEQENLSTRKKRTIRRVAFDDSSILIPVLCASIDAENTCSICLDPFDDDDGPTSVVRLPPCSPGHYFHRICIAQAIKLRDKCPLCSKQVEY